MMTFQMVVRRDSDRGIIAAAGAAAVDVLKMTLRGKIWSALQKEKFLSKRPYPRVKLKKFI